MKKAISFLLCVFLTTSTFAGCGDKAQNGAIAAGKPVAADATAATSSKTKETEAQAAEIASDSETANDSEKVNDSEKAGDGQTESDSQTESGSETAGEIQAKGGNDTERDNETASDSEVMTDDTPTEKPAATTVTAAEPENAGLPAWGAGEGEGATEPDKTAKQPKTAETALKSQSSGGAYTPMVASEVPVPDKIDFSNAGVPSNAETYPDAEWNFMGYFWARVIACVEVFMDPDSLSENWPEESKFYRLYFQTVCFDLPEENISIKGSDFGLGGAGVNNRLIIFNYSMEDISQYYTPEKIGEVGYTYKYFAADDLNDITQAWFRYSVRNKESDEDEDFIYYITKMSVGNLIVNERPEGVDYPIPYSAIASVGEWSDYIEDPSVKVRTLAYEKYPIADRDRQDFMHRDDDFYIIYFEAENVGEDILDYAYVYMKFSGVGVSSVIWGRMDACLFDGNNLPQNMRPGDRCGIYEVVCAEDITDITAITIGSDSGPHGKAQVPFDFS